MPGRWGRNAANAPSSARKMHAVRECMLKHDIGWEREVSDDAAGLKVPLRITEGTRGVSFQLFKFPHGLSEQEPTEEACRQCTYLLGPADEASSCAHF